MSQRTEMLEALKRGESFTRLDALNRWGCAKAPARIAELRQQGVEIETIPVVVDGKRFARWKLRDRPLTLF